MTSKKTDALHQSIDQHEQDIKDLEKLKEEHMKLFRDAQSAKRNSKSLNQELSEQCTSAFGVDVQFPLTDSQCERVEPIKTECDKAKQYSDELEKKESEMSREVAALQKRVDKFYHKTSTDEVFAYQKEIQTAKNALNDLRARVNDQREIEAQIHCTEEQAKKLQEQRENLLADIATGDANEVKLLELDQEICQLFEDEETSETDRSRVEQTMAGLNRKIALAEESLQVLESKQKTVIGQYLHTLISAEAEDYLTNAKALQKSFTRMVALARMKKEAGPKSHPILPNCWDSMFIPSFRLSEFNSNDISHTSPDVLFSAELENMRNNDVFATQISAEIEDIRSQGITLL